MKSEGFLPKPVVDGCNNLGTEHDGERPFRDEIDQENNQSLFAVLDVEPFEPVLNSHLKFLVPNVQFDEIETPVNADSLAD